MNTNEPSYRSKVTIECADGRAEVATSFRVGLVPFIIHTAASLPTNAPTGSEWLQHAWLASRDEGPHLAKALRDMLTIWAGCRDVECAISLHVDVAKLIEPGGEPTEEDCLAAFRLSELANKVSWCTVVNAEPLIARLRELTGESFVLSPSAEPAKVPTPINPLSREITEQYLDGDTVYSISKRRKMPITHVRRHIDEAFSRRNPRKYVELQAIDGGSKPCLRLLAANRADFGF